MVKSKSILVSIVNYGNEQLKYLQKVIDSINSFKKYNTTIIVTTNVTLDPIIKGIDKINYVDNLSNWQLLPLVSRRMISSHVNDFDYYIYTENDHLWLERHVDNYIKYEGILPENYISGLIQYEYDETGRYYPGHHASYDWDYNSVEEFDRLKFAHFTNHHQASFLISNKKLKEISNKFDLNNFYSSDQYSLKCKVNTEIYKWSGYKKVICVSEFDDNLIHHLPNVYINGDLGRRSNQRSNDFKMINSLNKLLNKNT